MRSFWHVLQVEELARFDNMALRRVARFDQVGATRCHLFVVKWSTANTSYVLVPQLSQSAIPSRSEQLVAKFLECE